jgi:hypothetical protein
MIDRALRAAGIAVAVSAVLAGLGGCDPGTASGTTATPATPRGGAGTAAAPSTVASLGLPDPIPAGHVRVTGMVFSASGNGLAPDRPFERGTVVAIPLERFMSIQEALKHSLVIGLYLRESLALPQRLLEEDGVDAAELESDGTYALTLRPGPYALCLVEIGGKRPQDTPPDKFWIERWLEVIVTHDDLQTILPVYNRSTGEVMVLQ